MSLKEFIVEYVTREWFGEHTRYARTLIPALSRWEKESVGHGPHLAPGEPAAERDSFGEVVQSPCARTLTPALSQGERERREAMSRLSGELSVATVNA